MRQEGRLYAIRVFHYQPKLTTMNSNFSKVCIGITISLAFVSARQSVGQEQDSSDGVPGREQQPAQRIHYIEVPVALESGKDPEMRPLPEPKVEPVTEDDPEFLRRMNSIREYSATVEFLEELGGAWESGLVEQLSSIAELEQQQGNHLGAIGAFDRAIHINRISNGLHTLDQIPLVEGMITSYLVLGNWEQADIYNNYLFFVQQKAFGPNDPRLIPVLERLASWNMQAFNVGYGESLGVRLSSAQILFRAAVRMVGAHFGREDERFERYLRNLAISGYQASRHPHYVAEVDRPEFRGAQELLRDQLNEGGTIFPQGFSIGAAALIELADYYVQSGQGAYDTAEVITHLGDWHLLFDRRRAAESHYQIAWNMLEAEENGEKLIQKLFGQVVPIPTFLNEPRNLQISDSPSMGLETLVYDYADVSVDVLANGSARNVKLLSEYSEENAAMLSRLRREVRVTKFRPLLEEGSLVASEGHQFRYRYWY